MLTAVWEDAPNAALSALPGTVPVDQFVPVLKSFVLGVQVTVAADTGVIASKDAPTLKKNRAWRDRALRE